MGSGSHGGPLNTAPERTPTRGGASTQGTVKKAAAGDGGFPVTEPTCFTTDARCFSMAAAMASWDATIAALGSLAAGAAGTAEPAGGRITPCAAIAFS